MRYNIYSTFIRAVFALARCRKENSNQKNQDTVTDIDGNVHINVQTDEQVWIAENIKTTKFRLNPNNSLAIIYTC